MLVVLGLEVVVVVVVEVIELVVLVKVLNTKAQLTTTTTSQNNKKNYIFNVGKFSLFKKNLNNYYHNHTNCRLGGGGK